MIAYQILVQTIADWKAGARPTAPTPPPTYAGAPERVEELSSGVVDLDEEYADVAEDGYEQDEAQAYGEGEYGEGEYVEGDQPQYSEGQYSEAQEYGEDQHDQARRDQVHDQGQYEEPSPTETYDETVE